MRAEFARTFALGLLVATAWLDPAGACQEAPARGSVGISPGEHVLIDNRPEGTSTRVAIDLPVESVAAAQRDLPGLDLQMRLKDVKVVTTPHGDVVVVDTDAGPMNLDANEYVRALVNTKVAVEAGGFFYKLFNISKPWGFLWISIGFLGQAMFTFRMVLQWWASEKHKRSIVPVGFWWGSLLGGVMLFVYFVWRKDIVGIVGQSTGVFVYARNLVLIYGGKKIESEGARTLDGGHDELPNSGAVSARKT